MLLTFSHLKLTHFLVHPSIADRESSRMPPQNPPKHANLKSVPVTPEQEAIKKHSLMHSHLASVKPWNHQVLISKEKILKTHKLLDLLVPS